MPRTTSGIPLHVWVDETRPRNQGLLTAWELAAHGVPHTLIVDNAGGHLMQRGQVDMVIVGADRVSAQGDVANKIGTYLKALAAHDCGIPFYAAVPSPTIDWTIGDGMQIPIEERAASEVLTVAGLDAAGDAGERASVADGYRGRQPGVRCHAGTSGDRHHHRARRRRARAAGRPVPGAAARRMTTLAEDGPELRRAVIDTALAMNAAGINVNKSGNVSARCARGAQTFEDYERGPASGSADALSGELTNVTYLRSPEAGPRGT